MKLIIENRSGSVYAYRESEAQFKTTEHERRNIGLFRRPITDLSIECNLAEWPDSYFVVDV